MVAGRKKRDYLLRNRMAVLLLRNCNNCLPNSRTEFVILVICTKKQNNSKIGQQICKSFATENISKKMSQVCAPEPAESVNNAVADLVGASKW